MLPQDFLNLDKLVECRFPGIREKYYLEQMKPMIGNDCFRNIMNMRENLGGFAYGLIDIYDWVMNVVPVIGSNTLKAIYDRGQMDTVHNW